MTNYYVMKDNKIIAVDTDKKKIQNSFYGENIVIQETERPIVDFEFADTPEYLAKKLAEAKALKKAEISTTKEQAFKGGIVFNGSHFDCDDRAQDRTGNRLLLLNAMPVETLEWLDFDYKPVVFTAVEFQLLCASIFEQVQFIEFKTGEFLNAVEAAVSLEELEAININYTGEENE